MTKKQPLNYAILKYFTTVEDASVDDVRRDLASEYGSFAAFKRSSVIRALMTAEKNGLLEESRFDLDDEDNVRIYYRTNDEQKKTINFYIE